MDAEYVMMKIPGSNKASVWSVHQRRTQALRQWAVAKADQDFTRAEDAIRWTMTSVRPAPSQGAWRQWQDAMSSMPMEIPVMAGERIIDRPLCHDPLDLGDALDDSFLAPLGRVNIDDILRGLQEFDPLSWHCHMRQVQHHWFINHQRNCQAPPWIGASWWCLPRGRWHTIPQARLLTRKDPATGVVRNGGDGAPPRGTTNGGLPSHRRIISSVSTAPSSNHRRTNEVMRKRPRTDPHQRHPPAVAESSSNSPAGLPSPVADDR